MHSLVSSSDDQPSGKSVARKSVKNQRSAIGKKSNFEAKSDISTDVGLDFCGNYQARLQSVVDKLMCLEW